MNKNIKLLAFAMTMLCAKANAQNNTSSSADSLVISEILAELENHQKDLLIRYSIAQMNYMGSTGKQRRQYKREMKEIKEQMNSKTITYHGLRVHIGPLKLGILEYEATYKSR
jgi:tagatose-1,6-bisphosphate aldolase non-catalytic subunit AgaZ/GatZ